MSTVAALILWLTVTAYVVFGGAGYGGGFWDLLAGGTRRGERPRELIEHSMAPVWEANNVWLIFALVVLWTAFPVAFASITSTLYLPLALALVGIVLRGAGFAFREATRATRARRLFGAVFALSSLFIPFFLGAAFGAIAAGRVPVGLTGGDAWSSWLGPTSLLVGGLAVLAAAFIAAVFLTFEAHRASDDALERYFRRRAIATAVATGALALFGLFVLARDAPVILHGLLREGLPLVVLSAACGAASLMLLARRITRWTRPLAAGAVAALLWGWGAAQYPLLLPPSLTIAAAAGAPRTLVWLLALFLLAAIAVVPSLLLLFVLDARSSLVEGATTPGQTRRHRVVVVGGGFGGLFATRALGWSPVSVTLVDRQPHHLFQPLLYQVATGILSEGEIAPSLRQVLRHQRNAAVVLAEVTGLDLPNRTLSAKSPEGEPVEIPYDTLVVAAGAGQSYFGHDELAVHAPGMKTLEDALRLRARLLQALEAAELCDDLRERQGWLTVAIVGAGPTGVELAGQIRHLVVRALGEGFRRVDPRHIRVVLLDAGKEPLVHFGDRLSEKVSRELANLGVELKMGVRVTSVDAEGVDLQIGNNRERIPARTVVWAAGVEASPLGRMLADAAGASCDRAGRVEVLPDCTVPRHPEVFVIGDMASLDHLPGVAEVAMQQGLHVARMIRRRVAGEPASSAFRYHDMGSMAAVGGFSAVVSLKGVRFAGVLGWLTWLVVHITFLTGFGNRFATLMRWGRALFGTRSELAFSAHRAGSRGGHA